MRNMLIGALETRRILLCASLAGALALPAASGWAAQEALLTSVKGQASSSAGALDSHAAIDDGDELKTGEESGCSVLLDENAVLELCGQTRISFATDARRGNRIVNVESGTLRMVVEPREPGERIEIHTPAAIATILGTIIYVTVDPATGEATFTSSDSRVNIRARDELDCTPAGLPAEAGIPRCAEGTTIGALEQLTVAPSGAPREKRQVSEQELTQLGGCLLDFHEIAVQVDRMAQANRATQRVVAIDVAAVELPPVSIEEAAPVAETESEETVEVEVELDPFDDPAQEEIIREMFEPEVPDCGGGIPGDHCNF